MLAIFPQHTFISNLYVTFYRISSSISKVTKKILFVMQTNIGSLNYCKMHDLFFVVLWCKLEAIA